MPGKGDTNPATGQPYAWNPATRAWDDNYWVNTVEPALKKQYGQSSGSSSGGGTTTADALIKASIDKYTQLTDQYNSKLNEFDTKNPFVFDDILKKETENTTQRLDPYYQQTLGDFLRGVDTKLTRSTEDRSRLLTELSQDTDTYTGDAKIALDKALNQSREGYADAGLYGSGQQMRNSGELTASSNRNLDKFGMSQDRQAGNINRTADRNATDLGVEKSTGVRDINQEKSYNVQTQSLAETLRRQQQREFEKNQYAGPAPGVDPTTFSQYSYGLLQ